MTNSSNQELGNCFVKDAINILGEVVLKHNNSYQKVRRYVQGKHPDLGPIFIGLSGDWETIWDVDVIRPIAITTINEFIVTTI